MLEGKESVAVSYRALNPDDLDDLVTLVQDERFIQGYGKSLDDGYVEDWDQYHECFSIWRDENQEWLGFMTLTKDETYPKEAWVSIGIKPSWWGKGVGTRVLKLFIEECFHQRGFHLLRLSLFSTNERAVRLYQKLGFQLERIYPLNPLADKEVVVVYQLYLSREVAK